MPDIMKGAIEKTGQMLFRDNGNVKFRQILIEDASLVEKKSGVVLEGWKHYFKLQFPFEGRPGIMAGMYTLCHERDIVYDPFNILSEEEKPDKDTALGLFNRRGIKEIAQGKCYKHEQQKPASTMMDKVTLALIPIVLMLGIAIFKNWMG